jgi:hypothetical protein
LLRSGASTTRTTGSCRNRAGVAADRALAQSRTCNGADGRVSGRSVTDTKGNTIYYDSMGRNTGRSTTSNGTTTTYDPMGRQTGTVTSKGR